jgi:hypothetical protein
MLKKNDKIILIVGVVILIIAGIGIAMYTVSDDGDKEVGEQTPEKMTYTYSWEQKTGEVTVGSTLYTGKSEPYEESVAIKSMEGTVLTSVIFKLNWEDDSTYGLIMKKGLDTLTAEISLNGKTIDYSSKGEGNFTFSFSPYSRPAGDSVEAEDKSDAESEINAMLEGKNQADFDVKVSIQTGERIIRLLKFLRDKGNDFELTAEYTYYQYTLEEPDDNSNDNNDDDMKESGDNGDNHNIGDFYINLGYGRGMI